jgi:predicted hotdog family 3-hydroxylacyl-ACP dehydratase
MTPPPGRAEIQTLIPHQGRMCLLDSVEQWDEIGIVCRSNTHRDPAHPLRRDGKLSAVHLIEYGAQAMAVHGGLLERARGGAARPGLLVAVREVKLEIECLDGLAAELVVSARRLMADAGGWLYSFAVEAGGKKLASGRVGVIPPAQK